MYRAPLMSPRGIPCNPPPWGTLSAIRVSDGSIAWEKPVGTLTLPGRSISGMLGFGGPLATRSGVVFIAGALSDDRIHAFDSSSGAVLWQHALPAGGQATPMTYVGRDGRQYVVIAAGGHGKARSTRGDSIVAFALPRR